MANVLNKLSDFISGRNSYDESEDDGYYDDDQEDDAQTGSRALPAPSGKSSRPASSYESNIFSINTNVSMQVVITHPQKVDDAGSICDYIKSGKTVVVNLEDTDFDTAQRVVDFLSGVSYSLDGDIQCVSNKIFILAPRNVDVTGQFKEELKENGFLFSFAQAYK